MLYKVTITPAIIAVRFLFLYIHLIIEELKIKAKDSIWHHFGRDLGSKITMDGDCSHEIKRHLLLGRKAMTKLDKILKKQRYHLTEKGSYSQSYGFSSSHTRVWNLDHKEAECQRIDAFELWCWRRLLRVPWTARRSNQSIIKEGDQSWVFIGRTDVEAETPILWPPDVKSWLIGKDPDAGKDWGQEEKGTTEDEMVEWHHWLNGHEFE